MNASIPVYNADGSLFACASEQRLARLQSAGLVDRVVRSRKGQIMRAILFIRPGEAKPMSASSMAGTQYSLRRTSRTRAGLGSETSRRQPRREDVCATGDASRLPPSGCGLHSSMKARRQIGGRGTLPGCGARSVAVRRARGTRWTNQPTRSQTARHGPPGRERVAPPRMAAGHSRDLTREAAAAGRMAAQFA